jgi:FkbM family methyltransferase
MDQHPPAEKSLRERFFPLVWGLLYPLRVYLKHFPIQPGKGWLLRFGLVPLLPPSGTEYELRLPVRGSVRLQYRETLGLSSLLYGTFEMAELKFVGRYLRSGDAAFDIGANVGMFSVVMGLATADGGRVIALEPVPSNVARLKQNLDRNRLANVDIRAIALGSCDAELELHLAEDAAYHSFGPIEKPFRSVRSLNVPVRRLDNVWREISAPAVRFVKIDVEGGEEQILKGAKEFLAACRPVVLIEANSAAHLKRLQLQFDALGFVCVKPASFVAQNYLFHAPEAKEAVWEAL